MFDTPFMALTAAGGNSRAARSLRARLQWRDRFGRWIEMGRGVKFKVRGADGAARSVIGSFVGAKDDQTGQVYVSKDPNGLPDGFYDVKSANAQEFVANLNESQLAERGIQLGRNANGDAVGERVSEDIPNINEMKPHAAPEGWVAQKGTFGGKKVIETDDGDFRVHFAGKDDAVLLEDHRANPGQAEPQRSVAEAFKKVADVDVQREESGDTAYTGLAADNDAKLAGLDRDAKIDQIKFNERQIANERVPLDAKQAAMNNNEALKKELADGGEPYDPEGNDSDEALAARKAAPAAPEGGVKPEASTGDIDVSTFDVSPEGFLVPTGKRTNDISPEGLANFMSAEKESLGKGGARLVVDTDNNTAEIHNSADTLDNAKAQAGGLGQTEVLDLSAGKSVNVADQAVDPNSPDVNPNLDGDTSPEAPNAEDRNPDAVESERADTGADAPVSPEPDTEAQRPAAAQPDAGDTRPTADAPGQPGKRRLTDDDLQVGKTYNGKKITAVRPSETQEDNRSVTFEDGTTQHAKVGEWVPDETATPAAAPGSVEELKQRRAQVQTALKNSGDPKDIIALNEQADALDNRISSQTDLADSPEGDVDRPDAGDIGNRMTENERSREEALRLINESNGDPLALNDDDYKRLESLATEQERKQDVLEKTLERLQNDTIPSLEKDYDDLRTQLDEANGVQELDFEADRSAPAPVETAEPAAQVDTPEEPSGSWAVDPTRPTRDEIKNAPAGAIVAEEHDETGNVRLYRKREDGRWDSLGPVEGPKEPTGYTTTGLSLSNQNSNFHYVSDMDGTHPGTPAQASEPEAPATPTPAKGTRDKVEWVDSQESLDAALDNLDEQRNNPDLTADQRERIESIDISLADEAGRGNAAFIARDAEGNVSGMMAIRADDAGKVFAVSSLYTRENGGGTGTTLMRRAANLAKKNNVDLNVIHMVQSAKPFYAKMGAEDILERDFFQTPDNNPLRHMYGTASISGENLDALAKGKPNDKRGEYSWMDKSPTAEINESSAPAVREPYQEPGDADATARAREQLDAIDAEIETELSAAAETTDPQEVAAHLARVRTLNNQRKIQDNALSRALGNNPMNFNDELGWSMRDRDNRGELPGPPEDAPETSTPAVLPEEAPEPTGEGTPTALDPDLETEDLSAPQDDVLLDGLRKRLSGEELTPEESAEVSRYEMERANRTLEDDLSDAQKELDSLNEKRVALLTQDSWDDEALDDIDIARDYAQDYLNDIQRRIEDRDAPDAAQMEEAEMNRDAEGWDADENATPEFVDEDTLESLRRILSDAESSMDTLDSRDSGGSFTAGNDPVNVAPGHENRVAAAKARMQGKDLTPEESSAIFDALDSDILSDNQLAEIERQIDSKPNRSNTVSIARPENEQPDYLSTADLDVINAERDDPNYVFDEDLVWRRIQEEFPDAQALDNGDLIIDESTNKGKRYQTVIRRTQQNRYMVYVMETDQSGNRRAKRISNTEWHSYEALENRITTARKLIHSKSPAGSLARRKDQPTENLGTMSFPADDFLGDFANPDADLPATGDPKFDRLIQTAAEHIRTGDANLEDIESHLESLDPGAKAVKTIMNAIIGRAQDTYRPDPVRPYQLYDGELAEVGMSVDWTDWHQELDWWITDANGRRVLNPDRKINENYGQVHRGRVMGYVEENTDGKGRTYGDHVWVQFYDERGNRVGNQVKRSAQTLRQAEDDSPTGVPFFSKREEWRNDPEELARRFRVPNAAPEEPVQTKERPRGDLLNSRRLTFTPRGSLSGYSNIPVPNSPSEIAGLIAREEITPGVMPASDVRAGMMIVRMDDENNQFVDSIIRVENLGDGGVRIHAARPDGKGAADVDSFVVPENADVATFSGPAPRAVTPRESRGSGRNRPAPQGTYQGKTVEYTFNGETGNGVVIREEPDGSMLVDSSDGSLLMLPPTDVVQLSRSGAASAIRADLLELLNDTDVPDDVRRMILSKLFSQRTTAAMIGELTSMVRGFDSKTPRSRVLESIFGILKVAPTTQNKIRAALKDNN